jgi:hypothetical protein
MGIYEKVIIATMVSVLTILGASIKDFTEDHIVLDDTIHAYDGLYKGIIGNILKVDGDKAIQNIGSSEMEFYVEQDLRRGLLIVTNSIKGVKYNYKALFDTDSTVIGFSVSMPYIGVRKVFTRIK